MPLCAVQTRKSVGSVTIAASARQRPINARTPVLPHSSSTTAATMTSNGIDVRLESGLLEPASDVSGDLDLSRGPGHKQRIGRVDGDQTRHQLDEISMVDGLIQISSRT
jgi:hypothetical protein